MKRVVMIAVIMAVITSLFAFSVYAAPSPGASYTVSISSDDNNITAYAYAVYEEGVYQLSSQGNEITSPSLLISIRVVNNTNKWVIKDTDQFKLRVNGIYAISSPFEFIDIENCSISEVATASGRADLTIKGDNSFVLAPNETYVIKFRFVVYDGFTTPSIQFFNNQFLNSAYTIDELISLPADELAYLSSINSQLYDLIDILSYTGTNYQYSGSGARTQFTWTTTYNGVNKIDTTLTRLVGNPYIISIDVNANGYNDTSYINGAVRYPIAMKISHHVLSGGVSFSRSSNFKNFLPTTNVGNFYINYFVSDIYDEIFGNMTSSANMVMSSSKHVNGKVYLDSGYYNTYLIGYIDIPIGNSITWNDLDYSAFYGSVGDRGDVYFPLSEYTILRDLYLSLTKNENDDNTEEAQDMNDDIHEQEQVWYDNNSEALEAVGLSNYRFSPSQSSGITQAVTQFQAVWNALGDWTNVYIFILILSISTYIIRHEPTTRVKQYRSSVQAERAERISYYGKKNAESRAASSGSTFKAALRRRK